MSLHYVWDIICVLSVLYCMLRWAKEKFPPLWTIKVYSILFYSTVKPDELVQLKPFKETDCLKSFKFINSNNLSIKNIWFVSK